jgi:hypothetical protein
MDRAHKVRDILSTFDKNTLPNEFRTDIFERINLRREPAECMKPLDLEGTIFQLAVNDPAVYKSLSVAQPVEARVADVFDKVANRIRRTLTAFDVYASTGNEREDLPEPPTSVKDLAERLRQFVDIIKVEVDERHPHGADRAAACIILLLLEVCKRNRDAFENNTWGRRGPRGETEDDRNLFQVLIAHVATDRPPFALDALQALPQEALDTHDRREQLDGIKDLLHRHQAPVAYRRILLRIIESLDGGVSPSTGPQPGQKRPAAGAGRGGQKRTK